MLKSSPRSIAVRRPSISPGDDSYLSGDSLDRKSYYEELMAYSINSSKRSKRYTDEEDNSALDSSTKSNDGSKSGSSSKVMFWHNHKIDTVADLVPEQVRWFYREDPKSKWIPFIGYDSLRIECRHRALEYSRACGNTRVGDQIDTKIPCRGGLYEVDLVSATCNPVYWEESSPDDIMRGAEILRGTWFFENTNQPLDEPNYASQIEIEHLTKFMGQKIPKVAPESSDHKVPKPVLHNIQFRDFHIDWYGVNEVCLFSESAGSRVFRSVSNRLGFKKAGTGTRLCRGYSSEACMDDKPCDIDHLVFVIHGIGQKTNTQRIINCCNDLRGKITQLQPKVFPELSEHSHRVEFLPVEWRSSLNLDGGLVDSITPDKLKNLRLMLNSTAMDILYYTSPLYRGEIIAGLETQLNRLYALFCERNPYFEANNGKVSVVAHSLGCVILYDILTAWDPIELYDQYVSKVVMDMSAMSRNDNSPTDLSSDLNSHERSRKLHDFYMKSIRDKQQSNLPFKVTNFFCLGSPLGVFLSLRGLKPQATGMLNHIMPKSLCGRIFNIYHPCDPIAYRLEPLVLKHYSTLSPLKVHRVSSGEKTPYTEMKSKAFAAFGPDGKLLEDPETTSRPSRRGPKKSASKDSSSSDTSSETRSFAGGDVVDQTAAMATSHMTGLKGVMKGFISRFGIGSSTDKLTAELEDYKSDDEDEDEGGVIEQTDLENRIDFVLPSGGMQDGYVGAIFSHTSYWTSSEVALFLLTHIYPELGHA